MTDKIAQLEQRIIDMETEQKRHVDFFMMEIARLSNRIMKKDAEFNFDEYSRFFMQQLGRQGQEHVELVDRLKPVFKVLGKQIKVADRVTPQDNNKSKK